MHHTLCARALLLKIRYTDTPGELAKTETRSGRLRVCVLTGPQEIPLLPAPDHTLSKSVKLAPATSLPTPSACFLGTQPYPVLDLMPSTPQSSWADSSSILPSPATAGLLQTHGYANPGPPPGPAGWDLAHLHPPLYSKCAGLGLRPQPEAGTGVKVPGGCVRPPHKTRDTFGKEALHSLSPGGQRPSRARSRAMTASSNLIMSVVPLCQCAVTLAGKPLCVSTASTMPAVKLAQLSVLFSLGTEM